MIRSSLDLLEARAQFDGLKRAVHIRAAEHAGHAYLDLADEHWRAVEIGPDGWRGVGSPPASAGRRMLPLPLPRNTTTSGFITMRCGFGPVAHCRMNPSGQQYDADERRADARRDAALT